MSDQIPPLQNSEPAVPAPLPPKQPRLEEVVTKAFVGPNGIRAAWRLLIFVCIWGALLVAIGAIIAAFNHHHLPQMTQLTPSVALITEGVQFACALLASWIMARIERRTLADYGLPARKAFGGEFWQGAVIGFVAITVLLVALRLVGVFYFGQLALHGATALKYAALWGIAFLMVGFFEEYFIRGYPLFTLTTGMTFWPAAILLSAFFGFAHRSNGGEDWLGAFNAGLAGFVFCVILRKTGDLWMAIGFHAAWDWGETYFYGVADSGLVAPGHLFNSTLSLHPAWLSGGSVGPEGSVLCTAVLAIVCVIFAVWKPEAKYPNPEALRKTPRVAAQPLSILSPQPDPPA
jgi:uncharacterized protein